MHDSMDLGWVRRLNGRLSPAQCRNLTARIGIAVQLSGTLPINSFHLALPPGMVKSTTDDGWWSVRPSIQSFVCSVKRMDIQCELIGSMPIPISSVPFHHVKYVSSRSFTFNHPASKLLSVVSD